MSGDSKMPTSEQLAYFAGFFDGEGCVYILKRKPRSSRGEINPAYQLCINITNTNPNTILLIKQYYGGYIGIQNQNNENWRPCFRLVISSFGAERFLRDVYPYLILKKEEASIGLQFRSSFPKMQKHPTPKKELLRREIAKTKLQELKRATHICGSEFIN